MILLSSTLSSFVQLLGVVIIFIFVLVITYFTTKWLGGLQKTHTAGRNLQVIETMQIMNNKYIQMIKTGEVYLVIAVGKDEVTLLAQLTADQLSELTELQKDMLQTKGKEDFSSVQETFQDVLDKIKERFPKKQD